MDGNTMGGMPGQVPGIRPMPQPAPPQFGGIGGGGPLPPQAGIIGGGQMPPGMQPPQRMPPQMQPPQGIPPGIPPGMGGGGLMGPPQLGQPHPWAGGADYIRERGPIAPPQAGGMVPPMMPPERRPMPPQPGQQHQQQSNVGQIGGIDDHGGDPQSAHGDHLNPKACRPRQRRVESRRGSETRPPPDPLGLAASADPFRGR